MCENESERNDRSPAIDGMSLLILLGEYIKECEKDNDKKKGNARFPNLAGFCRYCCLGKSELELFADVYPREYELMCSVFEDEALNSDISATLIGAYLKNHFGYGEKNSDRAKVESGEYKLIFEHDIISDGE